MRILLIHQYYLEENGSGGSRFNEMTQQWRAAGHEVTVLAGMMPDENHQPLPEYAGRYTFERHQRGVRVVRSHVSANYNSNFRGRLWGYFSFVFSSIYAGLFRTRGKFDVILVTSPPLFVGISALVLSLFKRTPFVFEVRDLWPESAIDTGVLRNPTLIRMAYWFEGFVYRRAKLVNVLTPAFRRTLIDKKGVPPEKVLFVPNAADFSISERVLGGSFDRTAFRRSLGVEDKFVIIYVGAHGVANHLIQVVDTAERLRDDDRVVFLLIGGGMRKADLQAAVRERGLSNVLFIDSVPKQRVFEYIYASDAGMSVLKKVDTFKTIYSNKTFDYMSCKRPIFMLIDGVSKELVESARCGVYVEPEHPADFVDKIRWMLNLTPTERAQLGENGYRYAREHFDRFVLATRYREALRRVVYSE